MASVPDLWFLPGGWGPRGAASARRPGCSQGLRWGPAVWVGGPALRLTSGGELGTCVQGPAGPRLTYVYAGGARTRIRLLGVCVT